MKKLLVKSTGPILFFGMLGVTLLAPTQFGIRLPGGVNLSLVDPPIWLLGALLALRILLARDWRLPKAIPPAVAVFLLFCLLSLLRANARLDGVKDLIQYTEYFLVAFLLYVDVMREPRYRNGLVIAFFGVSSLVVLLAVTQYLRVAAVDEFMVRGSFDNRNALGGFLSLYTPLAIAVACSRAPLWLRGWQGIAALGALLVLLAGGSLMPVILAGLLIAMLYANRTAWLATLTVGMLLLFVFPHLPRQNLWLAHDSIAVFTPEGPPAMRYPEWQAAAAMTAENPIFGVGLGNYQKFVGQYYGILPSENVAAEPGSQNLYLVLASTIGVPGTAAFLVVLLSGMVGALRQWGRSDKTGFAAAIALGAFAALLAFSLNCLWAPLLARGVGLPLVFILALATCRTPTARRAAAENADRRTDNPG